MIKLKSLFRRGQGPSGSKHSSTNSSSSAALIPPAAAANHLKGSSSVSSLDNLDQTTTTTKPTKNGGTKDPKNKGSRDKYGSRDNLEIKENKIVPRQRNSGSSGGGGGGGGVVVASTDLQRPQPMPRVQQHHQQQQQQHVIGNNNLIDQRDIAAYGGGDPLTKELTDINFDGPREAARHQSRMQELQSHLERITREKMALESKIVEMSTYQNEVVQLRNEITKLQITQDRGFSDMQKLADENELLRNRLRDVVHSPLSDTEKQQILDESHRLHSSAPASIALPNNQEVDGTPCVTPDWDKHSSSSEVSVACLQDKIIQMEETHYSTNEELQATLQELADLQAQLSELQQDNDRLAEEKDVLFQSLCRQTEKLEDSRSQFGKLQDVLLREPNAADASTAEREHILIDLLKNVKGKEELSPIDASAELRAALDQSTAEVTRLKERISLLECQLDASGAERKQIEMQLTQAKEESSSQYIEISRLTTLLENARAKIDELEQDRALGDKSDLDELLDMARKEKDNLEGEVASLQEALSKSQCEVQKLKDQVAGVTEECKVARNNAKYALSDMEYKLDTLKQEKLKLAADYQLLQETANELQVQCKCHLEDKGQLETMLSETQIHLADAERCLQEKDEIIDEEKRLRKLESEEWEQFQNDLLMTVRVANDFKTETQVAYENLVLDNKAQRDKIRSLEQDIVRLNKASQENQASLLNSVVQQEMAVRRQRGGISRQDSRLSVRSLIETIEKSQQQVKTNGPSSRCSSSSSLNSLASDVLTPALQNGRNQSGEWNDNVITQNQLHAPVVSSLTAKSPLREQQQMIGSNISINGSQKGLISDYNKIDSGQILSGNNQYNNNNNNNHNHHNNNSNINNNINHHHHHHNPFGKNFNRPTMAADNACVASILSQKAMEFARRNSYGDLSERKDPLNALVKNGGSKRNALLKWCQNKTVGYRNIDITNFSSSWNDGLAFCAILHSYLPDRIPYDTLGPNDKRQNFSIAFTAAESVGIQTSLNISDMCQQERPDWQQVMAYVTAIYKHFET